ncbi:MAG: Gfo/Idh/MocA family protein [Chromatiales bacterium]
MTLAHPQADLRIGIVGCGRATVSLHLPALKRLRGAAVVALCDPDAQRLRGAAARCAGATGYENYEALLADERVDLVAVCVPATLHASMSLAALHAGKHVFVEKPLALTVNDCDRMVHAAQEAETRGLRSVVGFNLRSHRLVRRAKAIMRSGCLGEIEMLRTAWTADWSHGQQRPAWHSVRDEGGGALFEIGVHHADLWRYLLDSEVESVHAASRSMSFDDQAAVINARMSSGALVSTAVSQRAAASQTVEVFGERASLRFSCYHADSLEVSVAGREESGIWRRIRPLMHRACKLPATVRAALKGGDYLASYRQQWERIIGALRCGGPMPCSIDDGREAVRIVLAALRSAQQDSVEHLAAKQMAHGAVAS